MLFEEKNGQRTKWKPFTVLSPGLLIELSNANIDKHLAKEIEDYKIATKNANAEINKDKIKEIEEKYGAMKWDIEQDLYFLPIDDALIQGIIERTADGYVMPELSLKGRVIDNIIQKYAKKNKV